MTYQDVQDIQLHQHSSSYSVEVFQEQGVKTSMTLGQVYGKNKVFDADRLIDLLQAFEVFSEAAAQGQGNLDGLAFNSGATSGPTAKNTQQLPKSGSSPMSSNPTPQPTNGRVSLPLKAPTQPACHERRPFLLPCTACHAHD